MSDLPSQIDYAPDPFRRSTWPTAFGVVSIVFGSFGLISGLFGIFGAMMMTNFGAFSNFNPPSGATGPEAEQIEKMMTGMTENMARWAGWQLGLTLALLGLAILLLVSGILLLNRRPVAAKLLIVWAYSKIVIGVGASLVAYQMQQGQMRMVQEMMASTASSAGGGVPASFGNLIAAFSIVGFFFGVLWMATLPVVNLIWLNREVIKADIATWQPAPASAENPGPA